MVTPDGEPARGPDRRAGAYPVGSGDAFLAGLVVALDRGAGWPEALAAGARRGRGQRRAARGGARSTELEPRSSPSRRASRPRRRDLPRRIDPLAAHLVEDVHLAGGSGQGEPLAGGDAGVARQPRDDRVSAVRHPMDEDVASERLDHLGDDVDRDPARELGRRPQELRSDPDDRCRARARRQARAGGSWRGCRRTGRRRRCSACGRCPPASPPAGAGPGPSRRCGRRASSPRPGRG